MRDWGVRADGEIVFQVTGPDAETLARAVAAHENGSVVWREDVKPTAANGWQSSGPWQDAE